MRYRLSGATLGGEQRASGLSNATRLGRIEDQTEAFHLAAFFARVTPNVQGNRGHAAGRAWARMK